MPEVPILTEVQLVSEMNKFISFHSHEMNGNPVSDKSHLTFVRQSGCRSVAPVAEEPFGLV